MIKDLDLDNTDIKAELLFFTFELLRETRNETISQNKKDILTAVAKQINHELEIVKEGASLNNAA